MPTPLSRSAPRSASSTPSTSSPDRPVLWDPKHTLRIASDCRCVGWASTKHRKCLNPLSQDSLTRVNTLLYRLSTRQPDPDDEWVYQKLRRLARYALCVKNHQGQVDDMAEKWEKRMENAFPEGVVERATRTTRAPVASREERSPVPLGARTSTSTSTSTTPSPALSRVSTSDISSLHLSRSSTARSSPSRSSTPLTQPTTPTPSRSCPRSHVRRRSLSEECPICQDDTPMSGSALSELVWCKSSCGRSVHRECFESWRSACAADGGTAQCTMCRGVWEEECACDERAPEED